MNERIRFPVNICESTQDSDLHLDLWHVSRYLQGAILRICERSNLIPGAQQMSRVIAQYLRGVNHKMPYIRSERMSISLVSRFGPATAAVRVSTENSRNYRMSLRLRISREIFMPIIIIPPRRDCVIRKLRLVHPAKEMSKGCYYLIEPHSNRVHPVLFYVCV